MSHVKLDVRVLFQTDFKRIVKTTCLNLHKSSLTSEELLIIMNTRAFKQSSNSGKRLLKWSHGNVTVLPRFASMTSLILRLLQDFVGLRVYVSEVCGGDVLECLTNKVQKHWIHWPRKTFKAELKPPQILRQHQFLPRLKSNMAPWRHLKTHDQEKPVREEGHRLFITAWIGSLAVFGVRWVIISDISRFTTLFVVFMQLKNVKSSPGSADWIHRNWWRFFFFVCLFVFFFFL